MKSPNLSVNLLGGILGMNPNYDQPKINNIMSFLQKEKAGGLELIAEIAKLFQWEIKMNNETSFVITIPNSSNFSINRLPVTSFFENKNLEQKSKTYPTKNSFIKNVKNIIEENIDDDTFGIQQLCKAIGISRSQLHNKIKSQTGISTSIFIRNIRLQKAKTLLQYSDLNIAEVAYEVGFKDPSYFSRLFTERFGMPPSRI